MRAATGQVLTRDGVHGRSFALRFRALGKRQYVTLGSAAEGWTRERADAELLDDVLPPERLLYRLFHSEGVASDRARALSYGCRCSRARLFGILEGFPADDLDHMAVDGDIVMTCEFCNSTYVFQPDEITAQSTTAS